MKYFSKIFITFLITAMLAFMASCSDTAKKKDVDSAKTLALLGSATATTSCMSCHSADTELGQNIRWAQSGWDASTHKNGTGETLYTQVGLGSAAGPNTFVVNGEESTGSNAFYANGGACQVCHTNEGFIKKINGIYKTATFDGSDNTTKSWGVGTVDASKDYIGEPSPIGCFTCHAPHDLKNLKPRAEVANGTLITTPAGAKYGSATDSVTGQFRGALCANCHVARMGVGASKYADGAAAALGAVKGTSISARLGAHHGPTTDMLLGKAGAQYSNQTYSNGSHTAIACTTCHFALPNATGDDFSEQWSNTTGTFGGNNGLGGHAFTVKATVHGTEKINVNGCNQSGCHATSTISSGNVVATATSSTIGQSGHLRTGDAYPKRTGLTPSTEWAKKVSELLAVLADPDKGCDGLLRRAVNQNFGANLNWGTFPDKATLNGHCTIDAGAYYNQELANVALAGYSATSAYGLTFAALTPTAAASTAALTSKTVAGDAAATDASLKTRVAKAIWNYQFVIEDKSFGHHNMKYALELLWDSINDLQTISTGVTGTFTGTANVTARP